MSQVKIEDAAFPSNEYGNLGMSLRDYFAARASENDIGFHYNLIYEKSSYRTSPTRKQARYAYADAMLAERQKGRE